MNEENIGDFEELTEELIAAAEAEDINGNSNDLGEATAPSELPSTQPSGLTIRIPPRKTLIPLKELFIYPEDPAAPSELEFYWKGGIAKLEETVAAYELLSKSVTAT